MLEKSWRVQLGRECKYCGESRRVAMSPSKRAKDGHILVCARCRREQNRAYRAQNSDALRAYDRERYRKDPEGRVAHTRAWRAEHPDYDRERYLRIADVERERQAAWRRANTESIRVRVQRRRAMLRAAVVERFTDREIFERDEYRCYLCGRGTDPSLPVGSPRRTVLEHRVPLVRGGEHSRANCSTACWECNSRKGSKTDAEYLAREHRPADLYPAVAGADC